MTTYTQKTWEVSDVHRKGKLVGLAIHPCHFYFEGAITAETEADARLIAAAPELLAALKDTLEVFDAAIAYTPTGPRRNRLCDKNIAIRTAIAKAT